VAGNCPENFFFLENLGWTPLFYKLQAQLNFHNRKCIPTLKFPSYPRILIWICIMNIQMAFKMPQVDFWFYLLC
jgi:hypothetical protein